MSGIEQAKAQYDSIVEMVENMKRGGDPALQEIHDDPLSVLVRSDWVEPGKPLVATEYEILLCTGGPAVRIIGDLNDYKEPATAKLQHSDWFRSWTDWHEAEEDVLIAYVGCFYFGE